ncbi:hypothetical protein [Xanthomonas axonopodis]|uniref:hypothetical protein n=1 Tax=Xanthomonas axonopodis TaxID=53413 RepID=UPI000A493CB1|nr:hypothetical protein [Xanthomonas axonopodis]
MQIKPAASTSHATASNPAGEASSSQAGAAQPQPAKRDEQQNKRAATFDGLPALPRDLRAEVVQRMGPKGLARLNSTSTQMRQETNERLQQLLAARPRYDPALEFASIATVEDVRASLHAAEHFPYPADEDRNEQVLRSFGQIAARLPALPQQQRFEAFNAVLESVDQIQNAPKLAALSNLMNHVGALPGERREEAFRAVLPRLHSVRCQAAQQPDVPPVMQTFANAIRQLPHQEAVNRAIAAVIEPGRLTVDDVTILANLLSHRSR